MKRKFLLIVFFSAAFFVKQSFAQIITNGGFENWSPDTSGYLAPDGWITNNSHLFPASLVQGAGRTGNYSAEFFNGGWIQWDYVGTLKPLALSGYWKGNFPSGYGISFYLHMLDTAHQYILGASGGTSDSALTDWTPFSYPVIYDTAIDLTYTGIVFYLFANGNPHGYLDDLTLTYMNPTGIIQTMQLLGSSVSSDVNGNFSLSLSLSSPSSFMLNIFSADGKKISEKNYSLGAGQHQLSLPTEKLGQGIYFCRVAGEGVNRSIKFVKH